MDRKFIVALLLTLISSGCCSCDSSCDYLPPVIDGPYTSQGMRTGSAKDGSFGALTIVPETQESELPIPESPDPVAPSVNDDLDDELEEDLDDLDEELVTPLPIPE